jgi:hypothetical protein
MWLIQGVGGKRQHHRRLAKLMVYVRRRFRQEDPVEKRRLEPLSVRLDETTV